MYVYFITKSVECYYGRGGDDGGGISELGYVLVDPLSCVAAHDGLGYENYAKVSDTFYESNESMKIT